MRCPICDSKCTHVQTENEEHTRLHRYKCNLCGLNFNTYECYTMKGLRESEEDSQRRAFVFGEELRRRK